MAGAGTSYVHGTSPRPLLGITVDQLLERACARWPERDALVVRHQGVRWSFRELHEAAGRLARGLIALGIEPGDRVAIWAPNSAEWVVTQFATARCGAILVNVNPAYRLAELEHALGVTGASVLITAERFKSSDYLSMLRELLPRRREPSAGASLARLRHVVTLGEQRHAGMLRYVDLLERGEAVAAARLEAIAPALQFDEPINIQFTSGTTGTPKAATLTHHNIVNNAVLVGEAMALTPEDRVCIPVPMYHCFGMVLGSLTSVAHGAAMVFPSAGFDARAVLEAVAGERCTALHGVPTMFIDELEDPEFERFDLGSLRTGIIAGAPCAIELMRRLVNEMHLAEITIAYGMTETGPVSFQTSIDDPLERRVSTVGRVLAHTEVKIVDAQGRVVPIGTPGELLTRGYCVMRGYWGDAQRTREAIDEARWIRSGDLATLDADGYCRIVGRVKDMLIRGGENIYPREIEEFLFTHPKVEDVQVIGVPDERYGEEVCAWIRLKPDATASPEEIRDFCKGKIAHFKIPRYIRFVDAFPLTATGKVQKFVMRETMARELAAPGPRAQ